jgi:glutamate--cysteine ligase catalytic subunit
MFCCDNAPPFGSAVDLWVMGQAAYTAFITLATRVMLSFSLNVYLPISKCDENYDQAHLRDACTKGCVHYLIPRQ